jgi:hypothetical protein
MTDSAGFFGDDPPASAQTYDRHNRYLLDVDGTGPKAYTRATTLAKTLEDEYHLGEWKARCIARGVALRDDLRARAAATPVSDKRVWSEIIKEAEVINGGGVKRNLGSAFHEFHERAPKMSGAEFQAQPLEIKATYAKYHAALQQCGIVEIMTEVTVANTKIGTAGKVDGIARLKDGRLVIIDRKSGRITEYPHSAAVQLAIYANADVIITYDENGAAVRHPMPDVDKHTAIVIDVTIGDENTASVAVYELDIWSGWAAALLAANVRRWRNRRDLIAPFHPDAFAASAVVKPPTAAQFVAESGLAAPLPVAESPAEIGRQADEHNRAQAFGHVPDPVEVAHGPAANVPRPVPYSNISETSDGVDVATAVRQQAQAIANAPDPLADTMLGINAAVADVSPAAAASVAAHLTDDLGGGYVQPAHAAHPITKQAWSSAEQRNITLNPDGTRADGLTGPQVSATLQAAQAKVLAAGPISPANLAETVGKVADADALQAAYKTKAQLQAAAKRLDPAMEVTRTRKNLANDMVAHPQWAARRSEFLPGVVTPQPYPYVGEDPDPDPVARVQEASDEAAAVYGGVSPETLLPGREAPEAFSSTVSNAPGPVPPDPQPTIMANALQQAAANGVPMVPADASVQDGYTGPPPWEVPAPATVAAKTPEEQMLDRIAAAATTGPGSELAAVWQEAKDQGITWTPRLHQAAEIRHKQLAAAVATTKGA